MSKFSKGWIRIERKLLGSDVVMDNHRPNPDKMSLWIWILLSANRYESKIRHGSEKIDLPAGGLAFSYSLISRETGLTVNKVRRYLTYLKNSGRIDKHNSTTGSYLVVRKWEQYQTLDAESDKQTASTPQASGIPMENEPQQNGQLTINNNNNNKNTLLPASPVRKKKVTRKKKTTKSVVKNPTVKLDFLSDDLNKFISGVSDEIRLRWLSRYCHDTIQTKLQQAEDWSIAKGRKPKNVASLMNTFFKDCEHDKWKDEDNGCDPHEKALSDELNALLEEARIERGIDA